MNDTTQKKQRVAYICGPMTGMPEDNIEAFKECEDHLKPYGYKVFNPAQMSADQGLTTEDTTNSRALLNSVIRSDINCILRADEVWVLPGFSESKGAIAEIAVAQWAGKLVVPFGLDVMLEDPAAKGVFLSDDSGGLDLPAAPPKEHGTGDFDPEDESPSALERALDRIREKAENLDATPDPSDEIEADQPEESILQEADRLVQGRRQEDYGKAALNMSRTAEMWSAILDHEVLPHEVASCMIAVKLARLMENPHKRDSWVDVAGYAFVGHEAANFTTRCDA